MSQLRFCHTRPCFRRGKLVPAEAGSGYLGGFSSDLVLDSCFRRNDDQAKIETEVDLLSDLTPPG
jgi:hypothetical protein